MRIACVHIPQFALQAVTRVDPSLRAAPVAVVSTTASASIRFTHSGARPGTSGPVVQACSRAAYALGCRIGMTATAARALSPELIVIASDVLHERETVRALADALLDLCPAVEPGTRVGTGLAHLAMYCEVPRRTHGAGFGEKLLARLERFGIIGRIGIADDRFTAWVAASDRPESGDDAVMSVPRGGSAAFLAGKPLSLLGISPEVQHMLGILGVKTLGAFASLPAPSVTRPFEADYQALARGDSGHSLHAYLPDAPIREEVAIAADPVTMSFAEGSGGTRSAGVPNGPLELPSRDELVRRSGALSGPAAVAVLAERLALRLGGRGRCAARLELVVTRRDGTESVRLFGPAVAVATRSPRVGMSALLSATSLESAEELADAIAAVLGEDLHVAARLAVAVTGEVVAGDIVAATLVRADLANLADIALATPSSASFANHAASRAAEPPRDIFGVVLASTGSSREPFGLTSAEPRERDERRDAHRRLTRGKQRRRTNRPAAEELLQPRLFKDVM